MVSTAGPREMIGGRRSRDRGMSRCGRFVLYSRGRRVKRVSVRHDAKVGGTRDDVKSKEKANLQATRFLWAR